MTQQSTLKIDGGAIGRFEERVAHIADSSQPSGYEDFMLEDDLVSNADIRSQQILCSRGSWRGRDDAEDLTLKEAAEHYGFQQTGFTDNPPDKVCSKCWKKAKDRVEKRTSTEGGDLDIGEAGFKMRWKRKGKARSRWCDIIVEPDATIQDIDDLLARTFPGIDDAHMRLYGLEDEYSNSTLNIYPEHQHDELVIGDERNAAEITIGELSEQYTLWKDDRLSLVYDLATPSRFFYCILKEPLSEDEINSLRDQNNESHSTQAFITQSKFE